jgi:hypothetical protein
MASRTEHKAVWITTVDNPFDPFTQWERWFNFDEQCGYRTCARVAAFAHTSEENLSPYENEELTNSAINRLYEFYGDKVYRIVVEGETVAW